CARRSSAMYSDAGGYFDYW
nr:immunoglobulin heavy chain junction region [Macaca mulatta]